MAYIYILASKKNGTLYTGVTKDIQRRLWQHLYATESFVNKYNLSVLVYYEYFDSIIDAIRREKYIKNRKRDWKKQLIYSLNPEWKDLSQEWKEYP